MMATRLSVCVLPHLRSISACVLSVCALLTIQSTDAQESRIRFCFNTWQPYVYLENGKAAGLSTTVLKEASRRAGFVAEFTELPWKRCLHLVETGEQDAVIDAAARDQFLQGPTSYSVYTNTFWVRDDDEHVKAFDLEALRGKTVGLVSGYVYPDELVKNPPYRIEYSVDDGMNVRKLAGGRVDAIVADLVSTSSMAETRGLELHALQPSHSLDRLYPAFNATRGEMQRRIDQALKEMIDDGYIEELYRTTLGIDFRALFDISTSTSAD